MTPMEVMAEQTEPMLTLTTDDDINWMVVTPTTQAVTIASTDTSSRENATAKPVGKGSFYSLNLTKGPTTKFKNMLSYITSHSSCDL